MELRSTWPQYSQTASDPLLNDCTVAPLILTPFPLLDFGSILFCKHQLHYAKLTMRESVARRLARWATTAVWMVALQNLRAHNGFQSLSYMRTWVGLPSMQAGGPTATLPCQTVRPRGFIFFTVSLVQQPRSPECQEQMALFLVGLAFQECCEHCMSGQILCQT